MWIMSQDRNDIIELGRVERTPKGFRIIGKDGTEIDCSYENNHERKSALEDLIRHLKLGENFYFIPRKEG